MAEMPNAMLDAYLDFRQACEMIRVYGLNDKRLATLVNRHHNAQEQGVPEGQMVELRKALPQDAHNRLMAHSK